MSDKSRWQRKLAGRYLLVVLLLILYTITVCRVQQKKDAAQMEKCVAEVNAQVSELKREMQELETQTAALLPTGADALRHEAELMARVLYGVKDNSTDDLRTLCWCIINRADNDSYPGTIAEVISQPHQWMGYAEENPVLEDMYQIAYDELVTWRSNSHRPVSDEYVYMSWSPNEIVLRNEFDVSSQTRYWRMK